jgi:hypothetical protein
VTPRAHAPGITATARPALLSAIHVIAVGHAQPSEKVSIGLAMEEPQKALAKQRMQAGGKRGGSGKTNPQEMYLRVSRAKPATSSLPSSTGVGRPTSRRGREEWKKRGKKGEPGVDAPQGMTGKSHDRTAAAVGMGWQASARGTAVVKATDAVHRFPAIVSPDFLLFCHT